MDEPKAGDVASSGVSDYTVTVTEPLADSEDSEGKRQIEGSLSQAAGSDGACNGGEDIMVQVLGSDIYVDGVCHNEAGDSLNEVAQGQSIDDTEQSLEKDPELAGEIENEEVVVAEESSDRSREGGGVTSKDALEVGSNEDLVEGDTTSSVESRKVAAQSEHLVAFRDENGVGGGEPGVIVMEVPATDRAKGLDRALVEENTEQGKQSVVNQKGPNSEDVVDEKPEQSQDTGVGEGIIVEKEWANIETVSMAGEKENSKISATNGKVEASFETNGKAKIESECRSIKSDAYVSDQGEVAAMEFEEEDNGHGFHEGQEMEEDGTDEENITDQEGLKSDSSARVHWPRYQLPPETEGDFSVSDLVWGKVRSHPWWPGQIFDPSDASEKAVRHHKKDCFLVAYFGDRTFAWNEASHLKPFRTNFSQVEKQSNSEAFQNAVDCALEEVSRRIELGLACNCVLRETYDEIKLQIVENAGIGEDSSRRSGVDESATAYTFEPAKLIEYIKELAQFPTTGGDLLDLVIAKAQLVAFYRLKGYHSLPEFETCGALVEDETSGSEVHSVEFVQHGAVALKDDEQASALPEISKGTSLKRKHNLKDGLYPVKKERYMSELMGESLDYPDAENWSDGKTTDAWASFGKKRKPPNDHVDDLLTPDGRKTISAAKVSLSSPKQSFKIGECIQRVASQLTGTPIVKGNSEKFQKPDGSIEGHTEDGSDVSFKNVDDSLKGRMTSPTEYSSLDELLSQLQVAAMDPLKGYSFLSIIVSFFSDFRDSVVVSSGAEHLSTEKVSGKRKAPYSSTITSSETFEFEDMSDTYWTDRVIQNGSEEQPSRRGKKKDFQLVPVDPENSLQGSRRPYSRKRYSVGHQNVEPEKPVGYVDDRSPVELIMNFSEVNSVPSELKLNKMFKRFGPLKESETEVDREGGRARVVFKKRSDAEAAFSSAGRFSIFGPTLVNYQLSYTPTTLFKSPPTATVPDQEMHLDITTDQYQEMQLDLSSIQDHEMQLDLASIQDQDMQLDLASIHYHDMEPVFSLTDDHETQRSFTSMLTETQPNLSLIQYEERQPHHSTSSEHQEMQHSNFDHQGQELQPDFAVTQGQERKPVFNATEEQDRQPGHATPREYTTTQELDQEPDQATTTFEEEDVQPDHAATTQEGDIQPDRGTTTQEGDMQPDSGTTTQEGDMQLNNDPSQERDMQPHHGTPQEDIQPDPDTTGETDKQPDNVKTEEDEQPDHATTQEQDKQPDHSIVEEQGTKPIHSTTEKQDDTPVHATNEEQETEPDHATTEEQETEPVHAANEEQEAEPVHATNEDQETEPVHATNEQQEEEPVHSVTEEHETEPDHVTPEDQDNKPYNLTAQEQEMQHDRVAIQEQGRQDDDVDAATQGQDRELDDATSRNSGVIIPTIDEWEMQSDLPTPMDMEEASHDKEVQVDASLETSMA